MKRVCRGGVSFLYYGGAGQVFGQFGFRPFWAVSSPLPFTHLDRGRRGIKVLAEGHDVDSRLPQGRAHGRRGLGLARPDEQADGGRDGFPAAAAAGAGGSGLGGHMWKGSGCVRGLSRVPVRRRPAVRARNERGALHQKKNGMKDCCDTPSFSFDAFQARAFSPQLKDCAMTSKIAPETLRDAITGACEAEERR